MKLLLLFFCFACSLQPKYGDRRLQSNEIPDFLKSYKTFYEADFFQKIERKKIVYEVKYTEKKKEVSVKFDEHGNFLEEERDIDFNTLSRNIQNNIQYHIDQFYSGAKIHEVETRLNESRTEFIDVEIRHSSSPTKYWELSFDHEGNFIDKKIEKLDDIETLN